jgi:hypothetical protein
MQVNICITNTGHVVHTVSVHSFARFFKDMVFSLGALMKNYFSSNFSLHLECYIINVILINN